jgi:hypothetical protein
MVGHGRSSTAQRRWQKGKGGARLRAMATAAERQQQETGSKTHTGSSSLAREDKARGKLVSSGHKI